MPFQVGESVVHPSHGVGQIIGIKSQQFFDREREDYYEISLPNGTVWVSVADQDRIGLRQVADRAELDACRLILLSQPAEMNKDFRKRRVEVLERLREGTLRSICMVVRDLTAISWQKPLSEADAATLHKIYDNLCREWAASTGLSLDETTQLLDSLLNELRSTYAQGRVHALD
ncbi:MAG TPA: CarD family transcriptional regulator [Anaerolineaceae bacterium]|nr:CarD family transcriptional regulator [Anaerolineaceae bacterium]